MNNILYTFATTLIIIWTTGCFAFNAGEIIELLLFITIVAILLSLIKRRKIFPLLMTTLQLVS